MKRKVFSYRIHELTDYINWSYFFHAWGFPFRFSKIADIHHCPTCYRQWIESFPENERQQAIEAKKLFEEACLLLKEIDEFIHANAICSLCSANSDEDNIIIEGIPFPMLRQQEQNSSFLCLSDFIRPLSSGKTDQVALFVASIDESKVYNTSTFNESYNRLLLQTLADRLAEATTEKMHEEVRKTFWGYSPHENFKPQELHSEPFQGIRPAVGYPSLPDQSINFLLDHLLNMQEIGVTLTEHGAMSPHASVCGFMFAHPQSRYFSIGHISMEQLADYAQRRGMPLEEISKYLRKIL